MLHCSVDDSHKPDYVDYLSFDSGLNHIIHSYDIAKKILSWSKSQGISLPCQALKALEFSLGIVKVRDERFILLTVSKNKKDVKIVIDLNSEIKGILNNNNNV